LKFKTRVHLFSPFFLLENINARHKKWSTTKASFTCLE